VREAFAGSFNRPLHVVVAEKDGGRPAGFLPLCWIEEGGCFGFFPGETWQGKTWLEQNRLRAVDEEAARQLLNAVPEEAHIRYLVPEPWHAMAPEVRKDEVGYLFLPGCFGYDFQQYWNLFSGKSRKQLNREIAGLSAHGLSWRFDHFPDVPIMFRMNMEGFGEYSYFSDSRFLYGFETLMERLSSNGMLRVTTLLLGGKVAAVDVGAVWNNTYTVLAGGASPEFPGVAKMINFHHLERACRERFDSVDFLCGDFGWKARFHLTPRPLYELRHSSREASVEALEAVACA
jgi:hypothetical protein